MKSKSLLIGLAIIVIILIAAMIVYTQLLTKERREISTTSQISITTTLMKLSSPAFEHNQAIPSKYTCDADDVSPPLQISEVPEEAVSLALIVDDPDAPAGDWVHWTVWNISPETVEITEGSPPSGVEGTTDFGKTGWGGPCPPSGTHRYFFKLYALDQELDLDSSATKSEIETAITGHVLDKAELVGLYERAT